MKSIVKNAIAGVSMVLLCGCSVFGQPGVEIAPYSVIESESEFEVRHDDELLLVSTAMTEDSDDSDTAFRALFKYISGANRRKPKISMTAPVVTDQAAEEGQKIAMTAPVLMGKEESLRGSVMSFVLPSEFTMETAPIPSNPDVFLSITSDLTVAVIRFNGLLREGNKQKNTDKLEQWISQKGYTVTGSPKSAGYNPPWTLPNLRRNEILIPVSIDKESS